MYIEIIKSDFRIEYKNVKPALKDIVDKYPEIKHNVMFKQRAGNTVAEQLQIALYLLGWHVRVHPHGYVMGIKSLIVNPLIINNYMETLKVLSMYASPKSYVIVKIDGEIKDIKLDDLKKEEEKETTPPEIQESYEKIVDQIPEEKKEEDDNEEDEEWERKKAFEIADLVNEHLVKEGIIQKKEPEVMTRSGTKDEPVKKKRGRKPSKK